MRLFISISIVLIISLLVQTYISGQDMTNIDPLQVAKDMEKLAVAYSLINHGREAKSPVTLITAAEIIGCISVNEGQEKPVKTDSRDNSIIENIESIFTTDPLELLEEAEIMSGNDSHILSITEEIREKIMTFQSDKDKGVWSGKSSYKSSLEAYQIDTWEFYFEGKKPAEIIIAGNGNGNLDVFLYDENDNNFAWDNGPTDNCKLEWHPEKGQTFKIEVLNLGDSPNNYLLIHN